MLEVVLWVLFWTHLFPLMLVASFFGVLALAGIAEALGNIF